jgi:hypothetical protein
MAPGNNGRVPDEWISATTLLDPLSQYDAGVILLDSANAVGGMIPAAVTSTSFDSLRGQNINFVGYPIRADYNNGLAGGQCLPIDIGPPWNGYRVAYVIESLPGMSGGPVYRTDEVSGKTISIRAVNTSIYNGMGNGLMIYPSLAMQIANWIPEVG